MSDDSAGSTSVDDEETEERKTRRANGMARRLKALFCCLGRESCAERTVEYDSDECDYVVEKLVIKRVPLALFAIPADLDNASRLAPSSAFGGAGSAANATREASTGPRSLRMGRTAANESLRFVAEESRDSVGGRQGRSRDRLDYRTKSPIWQEGIQSRFNTPKPDLKKYKCLLEDPPNFSRNRRSFTDISEATSSTRTNVSSQTTSSVTTQDDATRHEFENERKLRSERDETTQESASSRKERDKFVLGWNRKYIVSPFRVRRGSFNLSKPKGVTEDLGVDGKSLSRIKESYEDKSSEPTEDVKDRDLESKTAVRWRITIRRQRANATLEHGVSEVRLKTSLSEKICEYFSVENYRKK